MTASLLGWLHINITNKSGTPTNSHCTHSDIPDDCLAVLGSRGQPGAIVGELDEPHLLSVVSQHVHTLRGELGPTKGGVGTKENNMHTTSQQLVTHNNYAEYIGNIAMGTGITVGGYKNQGNGKCSLCLHDTCTCHVQSISMGTPLSPPHIHRRD